MFSKVKGLVWGGLEFINDMRSLLCKLFSTEFLSHWFIHKLGYNSGSLY
ncbi:MAG: hypothetical protein HC772_05875 [Leptolyngbyaceae cyanobacterium CRU_2_3]|nr:hypothetical protein [Leptolyngbyaceae cyanobacterium CRU_2_3]